MLTKDQKIELVKKLTEKIRAAKSAIFVDYKGLKVKDSTDLKKSLRKADSEYVVVRKTLLDIALKLEEIALKDDYFISRRLYPNVDFYSGIIYQAMGFPPEMFTVLFAIPRTSGWLAHYQELLDQDVKISRPRQLYIGEDVRNYVPMKDRK